MINFKIHLNIFLSPDKIKNYYNISQIISAWLHLTIFIVDFQSAPQGTPLIINYKHVIEFHNTSSVYYQNALKILPQKKVPLIIFNNFND